MANDTGWIGTRVAETWKRHASVSEAAKLRITELLLGPLTGGQLSATELAKVASALIADMGPEPPTPKTKR